MFTTIIIRACRVWIHDSKTAGPFPVRLLVPEISMIEDKRTFFHSKADISAKNGRTEKKKPNWSELNRLNDLDIGLIRKKSRNPVQNFEKRKNLKIFFSRDISPAAQSVILRKKNHCQNWKLETSSLKMLFFHFLYDHFWRSYSLSKNTKKSVIFSCSLNFLCQCICPCPRQFT